MKRHRRDASRGSGWTAAPWIAGLAPALAFATPAVADEPLFGFVNTTDLLPKGKLQVETWLSLREGDALGDFRGLEGRTELDYGLTSRVQTTLYLNYSDQDANINAAQAQALGLEPVGHYERTRFDGVTGEVIWRITSPYLEPVGTAVLFDTTFGPNQRVFGVKAIAQKNFRDDTIVLAANLRADFGQRERRRSELFGPIEQQNVTVLEGSFGASYRFRANWSAAVELRVRDKLADSLGGDHNTAAVFLGPTLHYGGERWYVTLSALKRISSSAAPDPALVDSIVYARDRLQWDSVRLRVGRTF